MQAFYTQYLEAPTLNGHTKRLEMQSLTFDTPLI